MSTVTIDDKEIHYDSSTRFLVEVGRGDKGAFKSRNTIDTPHQACFYYRCINIGYGYKKRFVVVHDGKRTVIARAYS